MQQVASWQVLSGGYQITEAVRPAAAAAVAETVAEAMAVVVVVVMVALASGKLLYCWLDALMFCYFNVFSRLLVDHVSLRTYGHMSKPIYSVTRKKEGGADQVTAHRHSPQPRVFAYSQGRAGRREGERGLCQNSSGSTAKWRRNI